MEFSAPSPSLMSQFTNLKKGVLKIKFSEPSNLWTIFICHSQNLRFEVPSLSLDTPICSLGQMITENKFSDPLNLLMTSVLYNIKFLISVSIPPQYHSFEFTAKPISKYSSMTFKPPAGVSILWFMLMKVLTVKKHNFQIDKLWYLRTGGGRNSRDE